MASSAYHPSSGLSLALQGPEDQVADHVFYTDRSAAYQLNERVSLYGGLRNAFDEAPNVLRVQ